MTETPGNNALGYGLLGLGLGLALFSVVYLVTRRAGLAEATSPMWLVILMATLLVPALIGAGVGWSRAKGPSRAPY